MGQIALSKRVRYSDLSLKLLLCCGLLFIPLFYTHSSTELVWDRFFGLTAGFLLYFSLLQFEFSRLQRLNLLLFLFVAIWIEAIIGVNQFVEIIRAAARESSTAMVKPAGIFQQVNVMGSFIALGLLLSGYLLANLEHRESGKFSWRMLPLLLFPIVAIHLLNTLASRTGWWAVYAGLILLLPLLLQKLERKVLIAWFVSIGMGFGLTWSLEQSGSSIGWQVPEKEIASLSGVRQTIYPQAVDMISERPILGYGYGNFEPAYLNFTAEKHLADPNSEPGLPALNHPHNEFLFWAIEGGIIALSSLLLAAFFVIQKLTNLPWRSALGITAILFPIVLHTQVEFPFYVSLIHWVIFVLLVYWIDVQSNEIQYRELGSTLLISTTAIVLPPTVLVFMLTTLQSGLVLARFESGDLEQIEELTTISNPVVWQDRIQWSVNSRLVVNSIVSQQPELAQRYIDWAPEFLERVPRPNFYSYLILAYQSAGDENMALQTRDRARYLFPNNRFELTDLDNWELSELPTENNVQ